MIVSFFANARDAEPKPLETTWPEFANLLHSWSVDRAETDCAPCAGKTCAAKVAGMAFSPVEFAEDQSRGLAGARFVHLFAGDLDHLTRAQVATVAETLAGLAHVVYSTHNHLREGEDDACLRVVIPLSRPVPAADWRRFWLAFAEVSGLPLDRVAKSSAQLLFLPSRPRGAAHVFELGEGEPLDVDAVMEHAGPPESVPPPSPRATASGDPDGTTTIDADARAALISAGKLARTLTPHGTYGSSGVGRRMTLYNTGRLIGGLAAAGRVPLEESLDLVARLVEPPLTPGGECEKALRDGAKVGPNAPLPEDTGPALVATALGRPRPEVRYPLEPWTWAQLEAVCRGAPDDARPLETPSTPSPGEIAASGGTDEAIEAALMIVGDKVEEDVFEAQQFVYKQFWHKTAKTPVLRQWRGDWYFWHAGRYSEITEARILSHVQNHMGGETSEAPRIMKGLISVAGVLIDEARLGDWIHPEVGTDPIETVVCANGLLHIPTRALTPATPHYFSTMHPGVAYDRNAPAPERWLRFMHDLWESDEKSIGLLQEWMGYTLTPDTSQQKILMFLGPPRSGRGTILRVLQALIGEGNYCTPTLSSLGTRFGLQPIVGKLAALVTDARLDSNRTDVAQIVEKLLSLSGDDDQDVDRKNRDVVTMKLHARVVVVSNVMPQLKDESGAIATRMLPLQLSRSFLGREDHGLGDALMVELPGILNWALEGWDRLNARGHFDPPASSADAIAELHELGSSVAAWLEDRAEVDHALEPKASTTCAAAYSDYQQWCQRSGHHGMPLQAFGCAIKASTQCSRVRLSDAARTSVYAGLKLRPATLASGTAPR